MRERRIKVLTEAAVIRKPGRPAKGDEPVEGQHSIWQEPDGGPEKGANVAPFPAQPSAAKARQVGAQTTGYSGSSIDKVDEIRKVAEPGESTMPGQSHVLEHTAPETVAPPATRRRPLPEAFADASRDLTRAADGSITAPPRHGPITHRTPNRHG